MWTKPDAELIAQGKRELHRLGLISDPSQVEAGYVVRMPKAYPVYDDIYQGNVDMMRKWLAANAPNVFPCGRNGMHRYNNQDHSMLTAMLSVENILDGTEHDVWSVNVEAEYHEEQTGGDDTPGRHRPRRALPSPQVVVAESRRASACSGCGGARGRASPTT